MELGSDGASFGSADALQDFHGPSEVGLSVADIASSQGSSAQACQAEGFVPRAADLTRQLDGLLVTSRKSGPSLPRFGVGSQSC